MKTAAYVLGVLLGWLPFGFAVAEGSKAAVDQAFTQSVKGLPEALPSQEVLLKDGDSYEITAFAVKQKIDGVWVRRLAYNGMLPGPLLRVQQGSTIKVTLKNKMDIETTLHPHGLRVDPKFDGIPGIGQPPIRPGESYEYQLKFSDYGMFWYHPHIRDDYAQHSGLYGAIIVAPKDDRLWAQSVRDVPLILDDINVDGPGNRFLKNRVTHTLMGRYGKVMLVNGQVRPTFRADKGETLRLFILNAANTRTFRLALSSGNLSLVGSEHGNMEKVESVKAITVGPGERYIAQVQLTSSGTFKILNAKPTAPTEIGSLTVSPKADQATSLVRHDTPSAFASDEAQAIRAKASGPIDYQIKLQVEMDHTKLPMTTSHAHTSQHQHSAKAAETREPSLYSQGRISGIEWEDEMAEMNAKSDDQSVSWKMVDVSDGKSNMGINWSLKKGNLYKIRIVNDKNSMHPMQHPIHFHGQRFVPVSLNGAPNPNLAWKDTILLGVGDTVDVVLEASNPGDWMAHCHILEHIGAGMMMGFTVKAL